MLAGNSWYLDFTTKSLILYLLSATKLNWNPKSEGEQVGIPYHQNPLQVKVTLPIPVQINLERIKSTFYAIF